MMNTASCRQHLLHKLPIQWNPTLCLLLQRSLPPQQLATAAAAFYQMRAKQSTASWDMLLTSLSRRQPRIGVQGELVFEPLLWSFPDTFVVGFLHFLLRVSDDISADSLDRFLGSTLAAHDSIPSELKLLHEQLSVMLCHRNRCNNDVENEKLCVVKFPAEAVVFYNSDHTLLTNEKSPQSKYNFTAPKGDMELDMAPGWRERETRKRICSSTKRKQKCLSSKDIDIILIDVNNVQEEIKGTQRDGPTQERVVVRVNDQSSTKQSGTSCYRDGPTQEAAVVGSSCQAWDGPIQEEAVVGSSYQAWDGPKQKEAVMGSSCQASMEALDTTADSFKWHAMALSEIVQHFTSPSMGNLTSDDREAAIDILIRRTLETQEDCMSRHLHACLSDLALTFPLHLASALSACLQRGPCSTSMAEIVASICKVWDSKAATHFLGSLCTPDLQLCEDLLPVVQCALTVGPDLSIDLLSGVLRLLGSGATTMAANAKYGRLVLTVVKAFGSQMTTSHTATLQTIASMHTSVIGKLLKTSIDRLPL